MTKQNKLPKKTANTRNLVIIMILVLISLGVIAAVFLPRITGDRKSSGPVLVRNRQVSVEEAYQLYLDEVTIVDVRTAQDFQAGHIPGAILIPLDDLAVRSGELPVGEPILFYCHTGNLSLDAISMLGNVGFMNLSSMDGGLKDWVTAGYPVEGGN